MTTTKRAAPKLRTNPRRIAALERAIAALDKYRALCPRNTIMHHHTIGPRREMVNMLKDEREGWSD